MTERMWDYRDNKRREPMLSEDNKNAIIVVTGIILLVITIFASMWALCERMDNHFERMYSMGFARTQIYVNGKWETTKWVKGNGTPVLADTINEKDITHRRAVEFLRNEMRKNND